MGRKYTDEQKRLNLRTEGLRLLTIEEPAKVHNRIKDINNRLRVIDRDVIVLEAERRELYLEKAKLLDQQDRLKEKKLGNTNDNN